MMSADADHHHGEGARPTRVMTRGHYPMSEQGERKVTDPAPPPGMPEQASPTCWPSSGYWCSSAASPFCSTAPASSSTAADPCPDSWIM